MCTERSRRLQSLSQLKQVTWTLYTWRLDEKSGIIFQNLLAQKVLESLVQIFKVLPMKKVFSFISRNYGMAHESASHNYRSQRKMRWKPGQV